MLIKLTQGLLVQTGHDVTKADTNLDIETGYQVGGALWNEVIEEEDDVVDASIVADLAKASNVDNDHSSFEGPEDLVDDVFTVTNGHDVKDLLSDSLPYLNNKESGEPILENRIKEDSKETAKAPEPIFVDHYSSETSGYFNSCFTNFKASPFYNSNVIFLYM